MNRWRIHLIPHGPLLLARVYQPPGSGRPMTLAGSLLLTRDSYEDLARRFDDSNGFATPPGDASAPILGGLLTPKPWGRTPLNDPGRPA